MKHTKYKPSERRFWEYSMDEFAIFDLPDTIDVNVGKKFYIL
jgi:lysosomal acid lipase/cholesteryl ester hydrolase